MHTSQGSAAYRGQFSNELCASRVIEGYSQCQFRLQYAEQRASRTSRLINTRGQLFGTRSTSEAKGCTLIIMTLEIQKLKQATISCVAGQSRFIGVTPFVLCDTYLQRGSDYDQKVSFAQISDMLEKSCRETLAKEGNIRCKADLRRVDKRVVQYRDPRCCVVSSGLHSHSRFTRPPVPSPPLQPFLLHLGTSIRSILSFSQAGSAGARQLMQAALAKLPWASMTLSSGKPARRSRVSMFWVKQRSRRPR